MKKVLPSAIVSLIIILFVIAIIAQSWKGIEGFKNKSNNTITLGNGQIVNMENSHCVDCRAKPGSQVTIDNCVCDGHKMEEIALSKLCRGKNVKRLSYLDIDERRGILSCYDDSYKEIDSNYWKKQ